MRIRFVLGPAGSGKTWRCLSEVRERLICEPDGDPLIFLAPKQATFQIERQLCADRSLSGYARLQILSFERFAELVFERWVEPCPNLLGEEGRVMVLRALLNRLAPELEVLGASARLPGFARQLSAQLREIQRHNLPADRLQALAQRGRLSPSLSAKLRDLARLLSAYAQWLEERQLSDEEGLLDAAARVLTHRAPSAAGRLAGIWMDGFAEMTPQELALLAAAAPHCDALTLAFCLDQVPPAEEQWLTAWSVVGDTFRQCHGRLSALTDAQIETELLPRDSRFGRFGQQPVLRHLEEHFTRPRPVAWMSPRQSAVPATEPEALEFNFEAPNWRNSLVVEECPELEAEAELAAAEIRRHVRGGGRFREVAVLVRSLESAEPVFRRVFHRHQIPCFIDHRSAAGHHPLAELTRSALRTLAHGWLHEDWFAVLKSGLAGLAEWEADQLENCALEQGWDADAWKAAQRPESPPAQDQLRRRATEGIRALEAALGEAPNGVELARSLSAFWQQLGVDRTLAAWDQEELEAAAQSGSEDAGTRHATVVRQLDAWLDEVERAFGTERLRLVEWIPILESALSGLTVGRVPPALDQVLVGAIDRSRNPDLQVVILPGWNEGVFPARIAATGLLTEDDRGSLDAAGISLGASTLSRVFHERFYAYIALTRARQRVVISYSMALAEGTALAPSPLLAHLKRLFPDLTAIRTSVTEVAVNRPNVGTVPAPGAERLEPAVALALHGASLVTSISRLEQFAACPFQFFASSSLRLDERRVFEPDARLRGGLQHELLRLFHEAVVKSQRQWRDLNAAEARQIIERARDQLLNSFRQGRLRQHRVGRFLVHQMARQLANLAAEVVQWMPAYGFDPGAAEWEFGGGEARRPAWELVLEPGRKMRIHGKIDRIDYAAAPAEGPRPAIVIDYKSKPRTIDPVLAWNGVQLQLPAYLLALQQVRSPEDPPVRPAGVVYASLTPETRSTKARSAGGSEVAECRFAHRGRFDHGIRPLLVTSPASGPVPPFAVRLKKDGQPMASSDLMSGDRFPRFLQRTDELIRGSGQAVLDGHAEVAPYRHGSRTACAGCPYGKVCRVDPDEVAYRELSPSPE